MTGKTAILNLHFSKLLTFKWSALLIQPHSSGKERPQWI